MQPTGLGTATPTIDGTVMENIQHVQQQQNTKIEKQQIEIQDLHRKLQEQMETMKTMYATKLECKNWKQQIHRSAQGRPIQTEGSNNDIGQLRGQVQDIKSKLKNLVHHPDVTTRLPRNPLFPNVNPGNLRAPTPIVSGQVSTTTHQIPPIPTSFPP